jgi:hypothetical protein
MFLRLSLWAFAGADCKLVLKKSPQSRRNVTTTADHQANETHSGDDGQKDADHGAEVKEIGGDMMKQIPHMHHDPAPFHSGRKKENNRTLGPEYRIQHK